MSQADVAQPFSINQASANDGTAFSYQLTMGEYKAFEAGEVALNMMQASIQHHKVLAMRDYESGGGNAHKKGKVLEQYRTEALELLKAAKLSGKKVNVEAEVKITIV